MCEGHKFGSNLPEPWYRSTSWRSRLPWGSRGVDPGVRTNVRLGSNPQRGVETHAPVSVRIQDGAAGTLAGRNHGTGAPPGAPGSPRDTVEWIRVRERAYGSVWGNKTYSEPV